MATFDQRNSNVRNQINVAGNANFGTVQNKLELVTELQKLQKEIDKAVQDGALEQDTAIDVEANLKKAIVQSQKPEPDKKAVMDYLGNAKQLLEGLTSAATLVKVLKDAIELVKGLL